MKDLTYGLKADNKPKHFILFGDFDSRSCTLHLNNREAPTPKERSVTSTIPYRQGVVDLSHLRGNRVYENREIVYTFYKYNIEQANTNSFQTALENQIMQEFDQILYDSYDTGYYYVGKCSGISTIDDFSYKRMMITISFDLYPFKICSRPEGNDLWDPFNFDTDVFQDVKYTVNGSRTITLVNVSQNTQSPTVAATAAFTITMNNVSYSFPSGTTPNSRLKLKRGKNILTLTGTGDIEFQWYKELI